MGFASNFLGKGEFERWLRFEILKAGRGLGRRDSWDGRDSRQCTSNEVVYALGIGKTIWITCHT